MPAFDIASLRRSIAMADRDCWHGPGRETDPSTRRTIKGFTQVFNSIALKGLEPTTPKLIS